MKYRCFRQLSTSRWLNVLLTVDGDEFSVLAETHREQIAAGWGIAPADLEVLDSDADARTGVLIEGPVSPPPAPSPDDALIAAIAAAQNFVELKAALLGVNAIGRVQGRSV